MENEKIIREEITNILESILGKGHNKSRNNIAFYCPFCNHHKPKLEVQVEPDSEGNNKWNCWVCRTKGKSLKSLAFKLKASKELINRIDKLSNQYKLNYNTQYNSYKDNSIKLPDEFISLSKEPEDKWDAIEYKHAIRYLKSRNINRDDIMKYNIGFCSTGKYQKRIIIPSLDDNGDLNFFIARSYMSSQSEPQAYLNPELDKNIIPWDLYVNWNLPVILVEGMFDFIAVKRNSIPLLGKTIPENLLIKLIMSPSEDVYIALDKDALRDSLDHCDILLSYGKRVYLVELDDKDPSKMGFEHFLSILEKTKPLTFSDILKYKLNL